MKNSNITCEHCVLAVTPYNANFEDKCDSFIIPISIVQHGKNISKQWTLEWNSTCPQQSEIIPEPPAEEKQNNKKLIIICSVVSAVAAIIIIVVVVICIKKKESTSVSSNLDAKLI